MLLFFTDAAMAVHQDMDVDASTEMIATGKGDSVINHEGSVVTIKNNAYPREGASCKVILSFPEQYTGTYHQYLDLQKDTEVIIVIGDSKNELQEQIETTLLSLKAGETFRFNIYVEQDMISFPIAVLCDSGFYELRLISFVNASPINQFSTLELFQRAKHFKDLGTELFKDNSVSYAFKKYSRAMKFLILISDSLFEENNELREEYNTLKTQCYLNIAACQLQFKSFQFAVDNCTKVLETDSNNVKALYRRAISYRQLGECENSLVDLERAFEIDPSNNAVKKEMLQIKTQVHNQNASLAKAMSKMFTS